MSNDTATSLQKKIVGKIGMPPLAAFALALGMVVATWIAADTWKDVRKRPDKNNIRITGSARKRIVSDLIGWSATIDSKASERIVAYLALKNSTEKAVEFLKSQGIKVEEIQTGSATIEEEFETIKEDKVLPGTNVPLRSERKVSTGFRAVQVVSVSSSNVELVEKASREITTLLEQGVSLSSHKPNYYYTQLGELKLAMLAEAAKDARNRADNILGSAGNTSVGKLVYADMGIININAANSTETSSEGNNDTSSYQKDIITIVHAEFEVK
jgi:hypothetical protein